MSSVVPEAFSQMTPVDCIVVYPHGIDVALEGGQIVPRLSVLSEMSIRAAGIVCEAHSRSMLVIPGEKYSDDPDFSNTTDLMADYIADQGKADPERLALLHRTTNNRPLNNTGLQTEGVLDYLRELPEAGQPKNIVAVTLDYHRKRVEQTIRKYGLSARCLVAEDILHSQGIEEYDQYLPIIAAGTRQTERVARILTAISPKLLDAITLHLTGVRLVNVADEPEKGIVLKNTTAKRELAVLRRIAQARLQQAV